MIDLSTLDTIIFDLGGVVVNLDISRTINAFKNFGISNVEHWINPGLHTDIFLKLEVGEISEEEFFHGIRELAGVKVYDSEIKAAWCAMLIDLPTERVKIIEKLKKTHRVILLSNTNSIHVDYFDGFAKGYSSMSELFHNVYYSFLMHDHKPNASIFRSVIEKERLIPGKTLFLDDAEANVVAAQSAGIRTQLVTPENQMEDIFNNLTR